MVIWGVAVGLTKCLFSSLSFSWLLYLSLSLNSSSEGTAGDVPIKHVPQGLLLQLAPLTSHIHPYGIWSRRPVRYFVTFFSIHPAPLLISLSISAYCLNLHLSPNPPFFHSLSFCLSVSFSVIWCLASCKKAACLNQWSMQSVSPWWELIRPVWLGET